MYDLKDPRSALNANSGGAPKAPVTAFAGAEVMEFHKIPPTESGPGYKTWYGRGQNFVLSYTECEPGTVLSRDDQPDEYMVFSAEKDTVLDIETENGSAAGVSYKLAIIPPGKSTITVKKGGQIVRLFSAVAPDLQAKSHNNASYAEQHPNIPPFQPWPNPPEGFKLRLYPMDPPEEEGRFGRLYRTTNLMINLFAVTNVKRDQNKLSPHFHDDFEQCSLTLQGDYKHYLRWPWIPNKLAWRNDEEITVSAPSITVIPPPAVHTSMSQDPPAHLIDIFAPPRVDFSEKAGWVLNAADYPMP